MSKSTKTKARYRRGTASRRCSQCTMFRTPDKCTAVAGKIERSGNCDYFKRKAG